MEDNDQISMFEQKEIVILGLIVAAIILVGIPLINGITGGFSEEFTAIMIVGTIASIFGFVIWTTSSNRTQHARIQAQSDLLNRMLDRFDSPEAMIAFLESPVGQQVFDGLTQKKRMGNKRLRQAVSTFYDDDE